MSSLRFGLRIDRQLVGRGMTAGIAGLMVAGVVAVGLAAIFNVGLGSTEHDIVILFGINAILVLGLQTFVGNTGIMSFGHVAFMGIGAYAAGLLTVPAEEKTLFLPHLPSFLHSASVPIVAAVAIAGLVALICGLVAGPLVVRLPPATGSIVTFALLIILNTIFENTTSLTRGNQTFIGVPSGASFGLVFGSLLVMLLLAGAFKWSRFGLRVRATREDPVAAEAAGIRVAPARLWAFALSAFITGVGGALWAFDVTAFSSNSFFVAQAIGPITMMVLGGYLSITGAICGTALMSVLLELLRHVENGTSIGPLNIPALPGLSDLFLGIVLVLILSRRPAGLLGNKELQVVAPEASKASETPDPAARPTEG